MKPRRRHVRFGHRTVDAHKIHFFRRRLLSWWARSRRHFPWRVKGATLYCRIVSEVLLQRTRAETVAAFWPTFIERFPTWKATSLARRIEIERILAPIGLARQRSPRLLALAQAVHSRGGKFPKGRQEIEALPGVGQYIANAILSFCHKQPAPLMDVNMARVLERFFGERKLADIRYDPYLQSLATRIVSGRDFDSINWAILDLGALVCRARNPTCDRCPLNIRCIYYSRQKRAPAIARRSTSS
jgi:A/G-specific adenine glycosylase